MKEFSTFRTSLQESVEDLEEHSVLQGAMPPNILILRRKTVRLFPGGTMVALYYNDKLDQYFSIPYGGDVETTITPASLKEEELNEISMKTADAAYKQRMADANYHNARATVSKDYFWRKEHSNRAAKAAAKGLHINRMMAKKIERNDAKSRGLTEDVISHLQNVKTFNTNQPLRHKDGSQTKVDPTTASMLLTVHGALHPDNQQKFANHLEHSKQQFNKMLDFGWRQVK
jgi:hypothetical protein